MLKSVNGYQRTLRSLCCVLEQDDIFSQSLLSPSGSKDGLLPIRKNCHGSLAEDA